MSQLDYQWEIRCRGMLWAAGESDFLPETYHKIGRMILDEPLEILTATIVHRGRIYCRIARKDASLVSITKVDREPIDWLPMSP